MPNTIAQLVGVGGTPPYTFVAPSIDPETSLPNGSFSITGSVLTINATSVSSGVYTLHVIIIDADSNVADTVITVVIVDPTVFTVLNDSQNFEPATFPSTQSIPLISSGGQGAVSWSLLASVTTLPGVSIDTNNHLNFIISNYGSWTVGIQATDSINNVASTVIEIAAVSSQVVALVDGQIEILVNVPAQDSGINQFTLEVTDSASTLLTQAFSYQSDNPVSLVGLEPAFFDHWWGNGDNTPVVIPITGDLSGYSISSQTTTLNNGLILVVDGTNNIVSVSGPPTAYSNVQTYIQLPILQGSNQVATITREYTLLSHSGTTDIGDIQCFTRPYIVEDFVGLNPLKPWFNSPTISTANTLSSRVQAGSALPPGLSLDTNTGLIYGTLVGVPVSGQSIIEYFDNLNVVHGTVTIVWDIQQNAFLLIDNLVDGNVQQAYSATIYSTSASNLTAASVYRGRLPFGLSLAPDSSGQFINVVGTPTEAGYFDLWFRVTNLNGQNGFLYHRLVIDYINPLVILTSSLPTVVQNQPYNGDGFVLQGYGGVPPYTWSLDTTSPAPPTGITLNSAGLISGTTALASYSQNLVIDLTDSRGVTTTAILLLAINNNVQITTLALPKIIPGQNYSFSMTAIGGVPPYTWSETGTLPTGISFNDSTGDFSGVTSVTTYSQNVTMGVVDTVGGAGHTASQTYLLQTGVATFGIDTSGIGLVDRGAPYQGLLSVFGTFTAPVAWQVAPDSPNALPTGLLLQANASDNGATAYIAGSSTALLTGYSVKIIAVDSLGASDSAFILLNSTSSLAITNKSLPAGVVTASYSAQLTAKGYNLPFTFNLASGSLPSGYSLSSSGLISGTTGATFNGTPKFQVTDNLGDTYPFAPLAEAALNLVVQASGLSITTTSILPITAGRGFAQVLKATGGSGNYVWSISPASANQLPAGLSLSTGLGILAGTTTQIGYSKPVTFRVTDMTNNAYAEKTLVVSVISGLVLQTGIDYTDGLTTSILGYIDSGSPASINPRPNYSFYVVATGVITSNMATLQSGIKVSNTGFTASVVSLSGGVAYISLSGPFASGSLGNNTFGITVVDTGVSATGTFKWVVYNDGTLRAVATNAFPTQLTAT